MKKQVLLIFKIELALLAALVVNLTILFTYPPSGLIGNFAKDFLSLIIGGCVFYLLTKNNFNLKNCCKTYRK